jgi:hypothetical protein
MLALVDFGEHRLVQSVFGRFADEQFSTDKITAMWTLLESRMDGQGGVGRGAV